MKLTGKLIEQLRDAIVSAFPSVSDLQQMVTIELGENLNAITEGGDLNTRAYNLIMWASKNNRLDDLVRGAAKSNDGNSDLQTFIEDVWDAKRPGQDEQPTRNPYEEYRIKYLETQLDPHCRNVTILRPSPQAPSMGGAPLALHLFDTFVPALLQAGSPSRNKTISEVHGIQSSSNLRVNELGLFIEAYNKLLVVGAPGSGKTTLLRHVALINASAWIAQTRLLELDKLADPTQDIDENTQLRPPVTEQVRAAWSNWLWWRNTLLEQTGSRVPRFPLLIELRRLRTTINTGMRDVSLLDEIESRPRHFLLTSCPDGFVKWLLEQGHVLLLLDGYDELGDRSSQNAWQGEVNALAYDVTGSNRMDHNNRVVASARYYANDYELSFTRVYVDKLSIEQQAEMVKRYYRALIMQENGIYVNPGEGYKGLLSSTEIVNEEPSEGARNLIKQLGLDEPTRAGAEDEDYARILTYNPLILSLIIILHYGNGGRGLEYKRHTIYETCVDSLLERRDVMAEDAGEVPGVTTTTADKDRSPLAPDSMKLVLAKLALRMQEQRTNTLEEEASISKTTALDYIADLLREYKGFYPDREEIELLPSDDQKLRWEKHAKTWLDQIIKETNLLSEDENQAEVLKFAHLMFQEHLAAWAIYRDESEQVPQKQVPQMVHDNMKKRQWYEVILLYLMYVPGQIKDVVETLLEVPDEDSFGLLGRLLMEPQFRNELKSDLQVRILGQLHDALVEVTIGSAHSDEEHRPRNKQRAAAVILQQVADQIPKATEILEKLVRHDDLVVRSIVIDALSGVRGEAMLEAKVTGLLFPMAFDPPESERRDKEVWVRQKAAATLALFSNSDEPPAPLTQFPEMVEIEGTDRFVIGLTEDDLIRVQDRLRELGETGSDNRKLETQEILESLHLLYGRNQGRPEVSISSFEIGRYPVTNWEYARIVNERRRGMNHPVYIYDRLLANCPAIGISLYDVLWYCVWRTEKENDDHVYRLATEEEWEWAARGPERRVWPWGDLWLPNYCRHNNELSSPSGKSRQPSPVGILPEGVSWGGVQDMVGNVWEWTATLETPQGFKLDFNNPLLSLADIRSMIKVYETAGDQVIPFMRGYTRGGSFESSLPECTTVYRSPAPINSKREGVATDLRGDSASKPIGFRIVRVKMA